MKDVLLSADGKVKVYSVPDIVADNLAEYCWEFAANWIWKNPNGDKLLKELNGIKVAIFNENDFIEYLNVWKFPTKQSVLVKELNYYSYELPVKYANFPKYNF